MTWREDHNRRIILDSGSYTIRLGSAASMQPNLSYQNFIAIDRSTGKQEDIQVVIDIGRYLKDNEGNKMFGPELEQMLNQTKLIYQKNNIRGVTVRFETYVTMLDELMIKYQMPRKTTGFYCDGYSMTLPFLPFHPRRVMEKHMEIYLEYFRFDGMFPKPSSQFIHDHALSTYNGEKDLGNTKYEISKEYSLVVESSQSATYITPFSQGRPVRNAIRRLDVGGRLLTNYLKEILSFRYLDLKNSDRLIKQIKEDLCFVSRGLMSDMRCPRGHFTKHFVLPDEDLKKKGYPADVIDQNVYTQHISLDKERFQVPEILFNPQDIGLGQRGLASAILESVQRFPQELQHNYLQNIIITGGNSRFPNFSMRLYDQLKQNSASWVTPRIYILNNPNACFEACVSASQQSTFPDYVILKDQYKEQGPNRILQFML